MARDVRDTIGRLLEEHCGESRSIGSRRLSLLFPLEIDNIEEYMKSLETSRRYLLDIWS